MNQPSETPGKLHDLAAERAFDELASNLREALLAEASKSASGEGITEDDLLLAYKRLNYPRKESIQFADAQAVISQALRENRILEWVSYGMALTLFIFGLLLFSFGAISADVGTRAGSLIGGSLVEVLILLPFRFAINSRRHNIALRMLGLIINRVDDPKKLAPLLRETFQSVVVGAPRFNVGDK